MPCQTKRQQQISKLSRKKGQYTSQLEETDEIVSEAFEMEVETIKKGEVNKAIGMKDETVNYWMEEDLGEFEKIGNRLITEALHWHKNAASSIRVAYIGDLRITI